MFADGGEPRKIAEKYGFIMDNDTSVLEAVIDEVISAEAENMQSYRDGNTRLFGYLMGQVMFRAGKGANPKLAKELLAKRLG